METGIPWRDVPHTIFMTMSMEQDMKLVVLGDIGVGKTSLIRRLINWVNFTPVLQVCRG